MEYLMTYGWAILIIAVVLAALFELGVFNGSNLAPQACIAESGFVCKNPVYTSSGMTFTFGQTTGRDYYGDWVFVAAQGEALNQNGIPVNFTGNVVDNYNAVQIGSGPYSVLIPGQTVPVDFPSTDFQPGSVPSNSPIGTPFAGYVWLGYCLSPCTSPTAYSKVATLTIKSTAGFLGPTTSSTTVASTTTSTTSTSSTTICQVTDQFSGYDGSCNVVFDTGGTFSGDVKTTGSITINSGVIVTSDGYSIIAGDSFDNQGIVDSGFNSAGGQGGPAGCGYSGPGGNGGNGAYGIYIQANQITAGTLNAPGQDGQTPTGSYSPSAACNGNGATAGGNTQVIGGAPGGGGGGTGGSGSTPGTPAISNSFISSCYGAGGLAIQSCLEGAGGGGGGGSGGSAISPGASYISSYGGSGGAGGYTGSDEANGGGGGGGGTILLAYGPGGLTPPAFDVTGGLAGQAASGYGPYQGSPGGQGGNGQLVNYQWSTPPITP